MTAPVPGFFWYTFRCRGHSLLGLLPLRLAPFISMTANSSAFRVPKQLPLRLMYIVPLWKKLILADEPDVLLRSNRLLPIQTASSNFCANSLSIIFHPPSASSPILSQKNLPVQNSRTLIPGEAPHSPKLWCLPS